MPSITLKNIPDALYVRLKRAARAHHRSLNGEVLHRLETSLKTDAVSAGERLERLRGVQPDIPPDSLSLDEILAAVEEGRP